MNFKRMAALFLAFLHIFALQAFAEGYPVEEGGFASGYIEPVYKLPLFTGGKAGRGLLRGPSYPAAFDLRDTGIISAPKSQGSDNVCWAFAAVGLSESLYLRAGEAELDFSEGHMRYATSWDGGNSLGFNRPYNGGGNNLISTAYLMRWAGLVLEEDDPFVANGGVRNVSVTNSFDVVKHIESIIWLPDPAPEAKAEHRDKIKELLVNNGPVSIGIMQDNAYENAGRTAYFYGGEASPNHAVTIIGWDDDYSKENFRNGAKPSQNGAWLMKNSWGSYNSLGGYFYLSYEDTYANNAAMAITGGGGADNYDRIYDYDPLGLVGVSSYDSGDTVEFANLFDTASEGEVLKAVSLFNVQEGASYEIFASADMPFSAQTLDGAAFTKVAEGVFPYMGYFTVPVLNIPISGEKFAVTARITTADGSIPGVPVEFKVQGYSDNATAAPGQSFARLGPADLWEDMAGAEPVMNNCIKAYTGSAAMEYGAVSLPFYGGGEITEESAAVHSGLPGAGYKFTAGAGARFSASISSEGGAGELSLLDSEAAVITSGAGEISYALPYDGEYFLEATLSGGAYGEFSISLGALPAQILKPLDRGLSAGGGHTLFVDSNGAVLAWGAGESGQLGGGDFVNRFSPAPVVSAAGGGYLAKIAQASARGGHSLVLSDNGQVYAWGGNSHGELGDGTTADSAVPALVKGPGGEGFLENIIAVSAGESHSVALGADGTVFAWGSGAGGRLGIGSEADSHYPAKVLSPQGGGYLENIRAIAAGAEFTVAADINGAVYAWGDNSFGRLGVGSDAGALLPARVKGVGGNGNLAGVISVSAGAGHIAAAGEGIIYAWGDNTYGQLGTGDLQSREYPAIVMTGGADHAAAGDWHTLAADMGTGAVFGWGKNDSGQVDPSLGGAVKTPAALAYLAPGGGISAGGAHSALIKEGGGILTWGDNEKGQLGNGENAPTAAPITPVLFASAVVERLALTDSEGAELVVLSGGESVNIICEVLGEAGDDADLIFAVFGGGRLLAAGVYDYLGAGGYQMPYTLPDELEGVVVKAFVWGKTLIPYSFAAALSLK